MPSLSVTPSNVRGVFNCRPIIGTGQWSLNDSFRQRVRYGRDERSELKVKYEIVLNYNLNLKANPPVS